MDKCFKWIVFGLLITTTLNAKTDIEKLQAQIDILKQESNLLAEELLNISVGNFTKIDDTKAHSGLGAAASKVYYSNSPLSIGGYGEAFIAKKDNKRAYGDLYRFIPYFGYRFSDSVIMNTEVEFEHGDTSAGGKVVLEFMYLDFLLSKEVNIRVGNLLVPMGIINLRHEPTLFPTVIRPFIERYIIPSTWHENGLLVYGEVSDIEYTLGAVNALNMANQNISDYKWIRNGRIGSSKYGVFKTAYVARVDYRGVNGLLVGGSAYYGDGSNKEDDIKGTSMSIFEVHAVYNYEALSLKALYTKSNLSGAKKIATDATSSANGYYVSVSYDIGDIVEVGHKIPLFAQYENYNMASSKANGSSNETTNKYNFGINFFPTDQTVLKLDYEIIDDPAKTKSDKTIYASFGFLF